MILYLLVPALVLGAAEARTSNLTAAAEQQNFTAAAGGNGTPPPGNSSSDPLSDMENQLQRNQTRGAVTEDDEGFQSSQDELPARHCLQDLLLQYGNNICVGDFWRSMESMSSEEWCSMENIISPYHQMTICLERLTNLVGCFYPNPIVQDIFVQVHSHFFQNCSKDELQLEDAPQWLVMVLTLIPVALIPVLVYLVVWKSKVQE